MPKKVLFLDEELFVTALSRAVEENNQAFVQSHLVRLDALLAKLTACQEELSQLRRRARTLPPGPDPLPCCYAAEHSPEAA